MYLSFGSPLSARNRFSEIQKTKEQFTNPIWAHASYWGAHVNPTDRANVSDSTVFKNQRNSTDWLFFSLV